MPANERARSFLFWVADFLSDPVVSAMDTEEVGAYILLLCYAWQSDRPGVLVNDDAILSRLTRLNERWPEHREAVLRAFVVSGKTLVQRRMVTEAEAAQLRIARAQSLSASGNRARWDKQRPHSSSLMTEPDSAQLRKTLREPHESSPQVSDDQAQCDNDLGPVGSPVAVPTGAARDANSSSSSSSSKDLKTKSTAGPETVPALGLQESPQTNPDRPGAVGPEARPGSSPAANVGATASDRTPEQNRTAVLGLLGGLVNGRAVSSTDTNKNPMTDPAWEWVKLNATPARATEVMRFVGWLVKTGTRDPETLLALVKHFTVHRPNSAHAYYTPEGTARQVIAARTAGDKAVAEHERIKREEREFLGRTS